MPQLLRDRQVMATYTYKCPDHGPFDKQHPMATVPDQETCPNCGQWSNKQYFAAPTHFKGGGWGGKP